MNALRLQSLHIQSSDYGINKGRYVGTATFAGQYGNLEIVLAPNISDAVLKLCADSLVANARDVAENLRADIIVQTENILEAPKEPKPLTADDVDIPF